MVAPSSVRHVGRYAIYDAIATGGMATVHLGRLVGPVGFSRTVAVKRLHPQFARDHDFVSMFLDEARLAARIQHPNVVPTLDIITTDGELFLVMEYIRGESLSKLVRLARKMGGRVPPRIAVSIVSNALAGLHAAHEAKGENGLSLGIVHRDVSPQNVLVGVDGVARVLDFGVAKAADTVHVTKDGQLKGKLLYMAPEQLEGEVVDRRSDVYAMGIILFEALTGERMFPGDRESAQLLRISRGELRVPSAVLPELAPFDAIVRKASARMIAQRYATARDMARALEEVMPPASAHDVGEWVEMVAGQAISEVTNRIREIESGAQMDRAGVKASLATELARTSMPDVGETSGVSSRRLPGEGGTNPTLATQASGEGKSRWGLGLIAAVAFLAVIGAIGLYLYKRSTDVATQANKADTALTAATADPKAALPGPTASATVAPPPSAVAAQASQTTTTDPPPASVAAAPSPVRTGTARPKASASAAAAAKPDCEQPYVVDSAGHMIFRRECL